MKQLKISKSITNRDNDSIDKYLQAIDKYPLLTADEEVELSKRIHNGDTQALETMINSNLRFVVSVAKQYGTTAMTLNDLINEGNLGLIKAAQKFDHTRWFKFISYAVWRIRQSIMQALAEHARLVRIPLNKVWINNKIKKTINALEQTLEREPTPEEIAAIGDVKIDDVIMSLHLLETSFHKSLDAEFNDDSDSGNLYNVIQAETVNDIEDTLEKKSIHDIVANQLKVLLTEQEYDVVQRFFGFHREDRHGDTLDEIGQHIGKTRERVRQIKEKALNKLRNKKELLKLLLSGDAIVQNNGSFHKQAKIKPRLSKVHTPLSPLPSKPAIAEVVDTNNTINNPIVQTPVVDISKPSIREQTDIANNDIILRGIIAKIRQDVITWTKIDHVYILSSRFGMQAITIFVQLVDIHKSAIIDALSNTEYKIIQAFCRNGNLWDTAKEFNISPRTVSTIVDKTYACIQQNILKIHQAAV